MVLVGKEGVVPYDAPWEEICRERMMGGLGRGRARCRHYSDNGQKTRASKLGSGSGLMRREGES